MSQRVFKELEGADTVSKTLNEQDFIKIKLKHRGMANMAFYKGTEIQILGHKISTPIGIGAIPSQQRFHYDGEIASAQAAKDLGIVFTIDVGHTSKTLEDIMSGSVGGLKLMRVCPCMPQDKLDSVLKLA